MTLAQLSFLGKAEAAMYSDDSKSTGRNHQDGSIGDLMALSQMKIGNG